jgi:hypothetical protein
MEMHTKHGLSVNGIDRFFPSLDDVTTTQIKLYYLRVLKTMDAALCSGFRERQVKKIAENEAVDVKGNRLQSNTINKASSLGPGIIPSPSPSCNQLGAPLVRMASMPTPNEKPVVTSQGGGGGGYVTTKDAYTLTHGPTIFLASDVEKVAKFCIQQAAIPGFVMEGIVEKIQYNNEVNEKMAELEKAIEDANEKKNEEDGSGDKKLHKLNREDTSGKNPGNKRLYTELEALRSMIKVSRLNDVFVPNTLAHLKKWTSGSPEDIRHAFKSDIEDAVIVDIMSLKNVADSWKVLLLMGVGVFTNHESIEYTEIMKKLADAQKLYLIIASSDYIYGTNYSFCHAYLSKDLVLTQEKIIQALGRVGRNRIQQEYTIRFRDDEHIRKIFLAEADKPEVANMNRLFSSSVE